MSDAGPAGHDDQLVAYLDGELSQQESDAVERQLADDPALRRRLKELQQAWDALDRLPQSSTAGTFTRSTIELVTREASREMRRSRRARIGSWSQRIAASILAVACLWGGFAVVRWFQTAETRQLARDLRVIENMDLYRSIDSLDFLQQLDQSGLFVNEEAAND
jgi:anti-sigma factor RsiW